MADKKITDLPVLPLGSIVPATDVIPVVNGGITKQVTLADAVIATFDALDPGVTSVNGRTGVVTLTSTDVGLANVNNTSDANKPVSTAQQTALNLKANIASPTFTGTVGGITSTMVGLGNVNNTSDVNKPVSTATQTALQAVGIDRVKALVGIVNATTPLTKYDLQAGGVVLRNSSNALVIQYNTATITCDLGLVGSTANGRDQLAAFTASSWVYLYFIWNGTTLATLASTTAPASFTGSTLPTGYTYWAFAAALRWNASSNIIPVYSRGSHVYYDDDGVTGVVTSGISTAFATVSCATLVPPVALRAQLVCGLVMNAAANAGYSVQVRATGSGSANGRIVARSIEPGGNLSAWTANTHEMPLGTSQSFDYRISTTPTGGGVSISVAGFIIPNGGE